MNKKIIVLLIMLLIFPYSVNSATKFVITETEKISLQPDAIDPDSDSLITAYSYPLNEKGEWQTTYGDAGEYKTTVTVSDGITNVSKDILIIVKRKEESPKIDSFAPEEDFLSIKEGDSIDFKISASDLNKDKISYEWLFDGKRAKDGEEFQYSTSYTDAGTHTISAVVSDGKEEARMEWEVNVEDVDRAPLFESIANKVVNENDEVRIVLNAADPDGDNITYSASNMPYGAGLEGYVFTWKPSYDTVQKEGFIDRIVDRFSILSKNFYIQFSANSKDKKAIQNIVITVKDVNRAPVVEGIGQMTINEGEMLKIIPKAYDLDGDKVKLRYSGFIDTDTYKSKFGDAGAYEIKVTASDGMLETSKLVNVNISHVNRAPVFGKINNIKAREDDEIAVLLNVNDPDNDEIIYSIDNPPEGSSLKGNAFFWKPAFDIADKKETKELDLVFVASDGKLQTRQIVKAEISDRNRAPKVANATRNIIANVNKPVLMFVKAADEDGDDLTYTWDFGFFEKYKATPTHQRIFTSMGAKVVKVHISDGVNKIVQTINVNVV